MRRFFSGFIFCITIFLLFAFTAFALETKPEDSKTFLWKVKSQTNTIYILGSIHLAKDELYPLNSKIEDAFAQANNLVVEANILEVDPIEMQRLIMENACYPGKDILAKHISKRSFELIKTELAKYNVHILKNCKFKPWYLAMMLEVLELQRIGYNASSGIDMHFLQAANGQKNILELESAEWQIQMFNSLKDKQQEAYLLYTINEYKKVSKGIDELFDAWKIGNAKAFEEIIFTGLDNNPDKLAVHKMILTDRNITMTDKIEGYLKDKDTYFIVVGAGHLVGEEGIISLLEKKGYKVEQI